MTHGSRTGRIRHGLGLLLGVGVFGVVGCSSTEKVAKDSPKPLLPLPSKVPSPTVVATNASRPDAGRVGRPAVAETSDISTRTSPPGPTPIATTSRPDTGSMSPPVYGVSAAGSRNPASMTPVQPVSATIPVSPPAPIVPPQAIAVPGPEAAGFAPTPAPLALGVPAEPKPNLPPAPLPLSPRFEPPASPVLPPAPMQAPVPPLPPPDPLPNPTR